MFRDLLESNKFIPVQSQRVHSRIHYYNDSIQSLSDSEALEELAYVSSLNAKSFLKPDDFEKQTYKHSAELFAFGYYNGKNIGASRHLNGDFYQIKGAGRNQLAIRSDYHHAWGGLEINIAFRELVLANILKKLDPSAVVNYFGFGSYQIQDTPETAFLLRERFLPRLAQLSPYNLQENEVKNLRMILAKKNIHSLKDLIQIHMKRFLNLMKLGLFHTSYNFENVTLDAQVLDAASLICRHDKDIFTIPEFTIDGKTFNYFYFLDRVLNKSVIPVGEKIFPEPCLHDLDQEFIHCLNDLKFDSHVAEKLLRLYQSDSSLSLSSVHQVGNLTERYLSPSAGAVSTATLEEAIQKDYLVWKKILPHAPEEAQNIIGKLIAKID